MKISVPVLQDELRRRVEGEVRFDAGSRALYSTDASNYRLIPLGVVVPRHEGDVIAAAALARDNEVAILPRGGGTSLAGQTCNRALVLDFSKYLNSIRADRSRAQSGGRRTRRRLKSAQRRRRQARPSIRARPDHQGPMLPGRHDRQQLLRRAFGPVWKDRRQSAGTSTRCFTTARGCAWGPTTTNKSLTAVARGGRAGEIVSQLAALRDRHADRIRGGFPHIPRRVSGYNLDQLLPENGFNLARALTGSEGTLALTLSATVRLVPRPRYRALLMMGFRRHV